MNALLIFGGSDKAKEGGLQKRMWAQTRVEKKSKGQQIFSFT